MEAIFLKILNMSITASWLVLAIIILRLILKKAPKAISVFMWALVGIRLICPFSFESILSLIPSAETIPQDIIYSEVPVIHSGVPILNSTVNPIISENLSPEVGASVNPMQIVAFVASVVWIVGIVAMLLYTVISYFRIHRKVREAVPYQDNTWLCDHIDTPFILGVIRPRIYLPSNMNEQDIEYVIAHEKAHLKRHDHWWKPLGFLLLTVYWFNPILWIAYILLCKDIELACDEKVIKDMGTEIKKPYSDALINCSVPRKMISACPLAFGEVGVKGRVKSVLNYKKPAFWIIVVAVVASIVVAVCFLTNPKQDTDLGISSQKSGSDLNGVSLEIVDADLSAPDPYIIIEWENDTDIKLSFGEQFAIYYNQDGTWENCSIEEDPVWNLPAYMFGANSTVKHTYKLNGQIMTRSGKYRFEAPFTIDGKNDTKYSAWIEFELNEGVEGITVHTFKPIELVYDDGAYSFVQTVEGAPTYMIVNGMQLIVKTNDTVSEPIGTFEEITLNKENFDSRFRGPSDYSWLANDTLKSLKDNNKRIWQLYGDSDAETPHLYILLEQNDGTFYLGFGYYNCNSNNPTNPDDSHIRWLYKLSERIGNSEANASTEFQSYDGKEIITEPPTLVVISNEQSIEALKGTYSWIHEVNNGLSEAVNSDSSHPLMLKESMPFIDILPSYASFGDPLGAYIRFNSKEFSPIMEVPPDEIQIRCWEEKYWGKTDAKSEDISLNVENGNYFFTLKDGNYIYEVVATWSSYEKFSGTVRYAFYTAKPNLDWESYPKIGVNSKIKDTYNQTSTELIDKAYENEDFVITKTHHQMDDGLWVCGGDGYMYRLEITGRLNNAAKNTTYIVLSNSKDITFEQTWKASGLSSLSTDYFKPTEAVIVGHKLFS